MVKAINGKTKPCKYLSSRAVRLDLVVQYCILGNTSCETCNIHAVVLNTQKPM